jgi:DNA-binding MarR family transcriptional regulator
MSPGIQQELKQKKPFRTLQQEAYLSVVRTSTVLTDAMEDLVKSRGISATQFNVLRILRGSGAEGLCRNALRDRMLTRMPDMTRLLDRMEEADLVVRVREGEDRRMVMTRITAKGRRLLDDLEAPVMALHRKQMAGLTDAQLRSLSDLLTLVRDAGG